MTRRPGTGRLDSGFTLVELLVASVILGIVGSIAISMVTAAQRSADVSTSAHQSVEEARLALNRVTRELRQATRLIYVQNPDGARNESAITVVSFEADFNGDGCAAATNLINPAGSCPATSLTDPEQMSYCHEPPAVTGAAGRLYVIGSAVTGAVTSCTAVGGQDFLANGVDRLLLSYRSNLYRYDSSGDGETTWLELDGSLVPHGNGNGTLDLELQDIDRINVDLRLSGGTGRDYRTAVSLRNRT